MSVIGVVLLVVAALYVYGAVITWLATHVFESALVMHIGILVPMVVGGLLLL